MVTNGSRLYLEEGSGMNTAIAQVSTAGGETGRLPAPFEAPEVLDNISPSRSKLLIANFTNRAWILAALDCPATCRCAETRRQHCLRPERLGLPPEEQSRMSWDASCIAPTDIIGPQAQSHESLSRS